MVESISVYPEEIIIIYPGKKENRDVRFVPPIAMSAATTGGFGVTLAEYGVLTVPHLLNIVSENPSIVDVSDVFRVQTHAETDYNDIVFEPFTTSDALSDSERLSGKTAIIVSVGESDTDGFGAKSSVTATLPVTALSADDIVDIEIFSFDKDFYVEGSSSVDVFAVFNDGRKVNITTVASYDVDNPDILSVGVANMAHIFGINEGSATITATFAGFSDSWEFIVSQW